MTVNPDEIFENGHVCVWRRKREEGVERRTSSGRRSRS